MIPETTPVESKSNGRLVITIPYADAATAVYAGTALARDNPPVGAIRATATACIKSAARSSSSWVTISYGTE
ncbi:MAG: hypothetical protein ACK55I_49975, partial [bacterium]